MGYTHYFETKTTPVDARTDALASELLKTIYTDATKTENLFELFAKGDSENPKFDEFFQEYGYNDDDGTWRFSFPSQGWGFTKTARKGYDLAVIIPAVFEAVAIRGDKEFVSSDGDVDFLVDDMIRYLDQEDIEILKQGVDKYVKTELSYDENFYETCVDWEAFYKAIETACEDTEFNRDNFELSEDEEGKLEHIASLIENGYTSGYYPTWTLSKEIYDEDHQGIELGETDLDYIATNVRDGVKQGELNISLPDSEDTVGGWWTLNIID